MSDNFEQILEASLSRVISSLIEDTVEHNGHQIRRGSNTKYEKNTISGHEYGVPVPQKHFVVNRKDSDNSTGPNAFVNKKFKSVDHAKKAIDDEIASTKVLRRVNNLPDDHKY